MTRRERRRVVMGERERIRLLLAEALALYPGDDERLRQFVHGMVVMNEPVG